MVTPCLRDHIYLSEEMKTAFGRSMSTASSAAVQPSLLKESWLQRAVAPHAACAHISQVHQPPYTGTHPQQQRVGNSHRVLVYKQRLVEYNVEALCLLWETPSGMPQSLGQRAMHPLHYCRDHLCVTPGFMHPLQTCMQSV